MQTDSISKQSSSSFFEGGVSQKVPQTKCNIITSELLLLQTEHNTLNIMEKSYLLKTRSISLRTSFISQTMGTNFISSVSTQVLMSNI
jgi:hypothetical protein